MTEPRAFVVSQSEITTRDVHCRWYAGAADRLVPVGRVGRDEVRARLSGLLAPEEWDHLVVWVAKLAPAASADLALRLAHLATGVAIGRALTVAAAHALTPRLLTGWDGATLAGLLRLDRSSETVTGVMVFGGGPASDRTRPPHPGGRFRVPGQASALTNLTGSELEELLAARRSVRCFAADPIPRSALLQTCLAGAEAATPATTGAAAADRTGTGEARWLVLARAVRHTDPAVYEYCDGDLVPVADLPADKVTAGPVAAPSATAACILQPIWQPGSASTAEYLNLLLRTGIGLNAAYLVACQQQLGGCLIRDAARLSAVGDRGGLDAGPFPALALGNEPTGGSGR